MVVVVDMVVVVVVVVVMVVIEIVVVILLEVKLVEVVFCMWVGHGDVCVGEHGSGDNGINGDVSVDCDYSGGVGLGTQLKPIKPN